MNFYYAPGACSQAAHIVLHELGFHHSSTKVDLKAKRTEDGGDYLAINPKGAVPALKLDSGDVLTENGVVLQYLGDRAGSTDLFPPLGDFRRYRVLEWLNFVATELHKGFAPLFKPNAGDETKQFARDTIAVKFDFVDKELGDGPFLMGDRLTLPDAYLFVMTSWAEKMKIGLDRWPNIAAFRQRMLERPAVQAVLRAEGLVEEERAG